MQTIDLNNLGVIKKILPIMLEANGANDSKLRLLRHQLFEILDEIGLKRFVTVAADILKNNFRIEGCNDTRMPLKRIFTIPLEELEEELAKREYNLPPGHPLHTLSEEHKDNMKKLKALRFSLGGLNLNQETIPAEIKNKLKQAQDYYAELDLHIRKEEEILFPILEENGMQEHPGNLREEHKGFREILSKIIEIFKDFTTDKLDLAIEEVRKSKEKFISDISNHILRETYIFYPAALEFINDRDQWGKIKEEFMRIDLC